MAACLSSRSLLYERTMTASSRGSAGGAYALEVCWPSGGRAGLPEAADRAIDQPGVERAQPRLARAQTLGRAGPEVLDVDVRLADQGIEHLGIGGILGVQLDAALVAVVGLVVRAVETALERAERVARARLLDLRATVSAAPTVAALLAAELGWNAAERQQQVSDFRASAAREWSAAGLPEPPEVAP